MKTIELSPLPMLSRVPMLMTVHAPSLTCAPRHPGGVEVVLFDVGHTLVHSERRHAREVVREVTDAVHRYIGSLGYPLPSMSTYLRAAKWQFLVAALWSRIVRREVQVIEVIRRAHARMGIHLNTNQTRDLALHGAVAIWHLFKVDPDARAMLAELSRRNYRLGLISNTWLPGILFDGYLRHEGLIDYFPVRVYSSEVRYMKPDRRIFDHALKALNVEPRKCVFIGDRLDNDVRGPARLGMRTIHFTARPSAPWSRGNPDFTVRRLREVPGVLASLV